MGREFLSAAGLAALALSAANAQSVLESPSMRIAFADAQRGFAVTSVVNRASGGETYLDAGSDGFWKVFLVRQDPTGGVERTSIDNLSPAHSRRVEREGENALSFVWEGIGLPGGNGQADVRARVEIVGEEAQWSLTVASRNAKWTAEESWYPVFRRVTRPGVDDVLLPTMNLGAKFVKGYDPVKLRLRGFGSPAWYPMVTSVHRRRAGLYVAAHDGEMRIKSLVYMPDGTLQFQVPLELGAGGGAEPGGPKFKVVTRCYDGDWWDAARIYRNWALGQVWTAKGPIAKRSDYPKILAETCVWGRAIAEDGNFCRLFRETFPGVQAAIRWYCWENEKFDTCYPDLTPRGKMKDLFRDARRTGLLVMPYVNGRLWDRGLASFAGVKEDACSDAKGEVRKENYAANFAIMCPTVRRWQEKLAEIGAQVVDGLGGNAVYYDQINCAQWRTCHAPSHPHPAGGGNWWTRGYREALTPVKEKFAAAGVPITSEGCCEAWMDLIDGALVVGRAPEADDVPFYPAVYSGYTTYFCIEQEADDSPEALFARQVRYALWGCATGSWCDYRLFGRDGGKCALAAQADVIRRIAHLRAGALEYLAYGFLKDELRPLDAQPEVVCRHHPTRAFLGKEMQKVAYPAVLGAVWHNAEETRRAVFAANVSNGRRTVRFRLRGAGGAVRARRLGKEPLPEMSVDGDVCSVSVEAQSIACIEEEL